MINGAKGGRWQAWSRVTTETLLALRPNWHGTRLYLSANLEVAKLHQPTYTTSIMYSWKCVIFNHLNRSFATIGGDGCRGHHPSRWLRRLMEVVLRPGGFGYPKVPLFVMVLPRAGSLLQHFLLTAFFSGDLLGRWPPFWSVSLLVTPFLVIFALPVMCGLCDLRDHRTSLQRTWQNIRRAAKYSNFDILIQTSMCHSMPLKQSIDSKNIEQKIKHRYVMPICSWVLVCER